ncbi:MAG: hypothetical protein ABIO44_08550, partial [Saprospiraceae bacterium]
MKNTIKLNFILLFLLSEILLFAQSNSDIKRTAHQNYQTGNFKGASDIYENLWGRVSFNKNELLEAAEAFRLNHKLDLSIDALQSFLKKSRHKQKYLLQLARTMQYQKQFYNAAIVYKDYLK